MPSFRDVIARGKTTDKDREKKEQQNYENKVKKLLKSCENFNEYLKDNLKARPKFSTIADNFKKNEMFGNQMKKNKLTSRTSRILNEMCKKISKIEGEYNPKEPLEFFEAFKFTPKKANSETGRIKRSAIDDAEVVKFFSQDLSITLQNIAYTLAYESRKAIALGNKSLEKSNKLSKEIPNQISSATNALNKFNEVKEKADKAKLGEKDKNAEKQVSNGVKNAADLETLKTNLTNLKNERDKKLKDLKEAINKPATDTDNINKLVTSLKKMNKNVVDTKNELEKKTTELQTLTANIDNTITKLLEEETKAKKAITSADDTIKESEKLLKEIPNQISNATNAVNEFNKVKEKADNAKIAELYKNSIKKEVSDVAKSAADLETLKTNLTDLQNKIDKGLKDFRETINKPAKDADKIKGLINSLNGIIKNAEDTKNKLENKTTGLQTLTETLDNDIDDATGPFNKKAETFIVSSVEDFAKIAEYKSKIKFLYIEGDVTYVQAGVGQKLNNLQYVNLSSKVKEIRDNAFNGLDKLETVVVDKSNPGLSVFQNAFNGCTQLRLFDLNCAKSIRTNAFAGCTSLKMITVGKATNISEGAFSGCTQLETVELGTVTEINNNTFEGCSKLKTISNTQSVTSIKDSAFKNCTSLTNITFEGAESINATAFSGCTSLEKVELKSAKSIDANTFNGFTSLNSINLESAKSIGANAFDGCTSLNSINLESAKSIGANAFKGCTALTTINLKSLKFGSIQDGAFTGCTALTTVLISSIENDSKYVKHTILKQSGLARSGYHIFTRAFAKKVNFIPST